MRDSTEVQAELDAAQADLETKIGELKQLVERELDGPRHVVEAVEKKIVFARAHAVVIAVAAVGVGIALFALRRVVRGRRRPRWRYA